MTPTSPVPRTRNETTDAADNSSTSYFMRMNDTFHGSLSAGDHDWIELRLEEGMSYRLYMTKPDGSQISPYMVLLDVDGNQIGDGGQDGDNPHDYLFIQASTVANNETLYVNARSFYSGQSGDYSIDIQVTYTEIADASQDTNTAYVMQPDDFFNGTIEVAGDRDWIGIDLQEGHTYRFYVNESPFSAKRPYVNLYDEDGLFVSSTRIYDSQALNQYLFDVEETGRYYAEVRFGTSGKTGTYKFNVYDMGELPVLTAGQIADYLTAGYWMDRPSEDQIPGALRTNANGEITANIKELTAEGKVLARAAMDMWTEMTGVEFKIVGSGGRIRFDDEDVDRAYADHEYDGQGRVTYVDVNIGTGWLNTSGVEIGSYSFTTYLHEIGHALGLGHGGNYNTSADYTDDAHYLNDSNQMSVMSYFDGLENFYLTGGKFNAVTAMTADLVAIKDLYGGGTINTGATTYGVNSNVGGILGDFFKVMFEGATIANMDIETIGLTIKDSGGKDQFNFVGYDGNVTIDMNVGGAGGVLGVSNNFFIARGTVIENYFGSSGSDSVTGNDVRNVMYGYDGFDNLMGGGGRDHLRGGDDTDYLYGGKGADKLLGQRGDDVLIGEQGQDQLTGGNGQDAFYLDDGYGRDTITDFKKSADYLVFFRELWGGAYKTAAEVVDEYAIKRDGNVVFDFGAEEFILDGIGTKSNLDADNVFIL